MRRKHAVRLLATVAAIGLVIAAGANLPALAAGSNLASGKAASASSVNAQYVASNLNDGNQGSYWESASSTFPQWAQIDLGTNTSINQVVLKLPTGWGARTETLSVQGSTDGGASPRWSPPPGTTSTPTAEHDHHQLRRDQPAVRAGEHHREHRLGRRTTVRAGDLRRHLG